MDAGAPTTLPVATEKTGCHAGRGRQSKAPRLIAIGLLVAVGVGGIGFALAQHWLTLSSLAPLLVTLPCAAMMLMCMRGHPGRAPDKYAVTPSSRTDLNT